MRVKNLPEDIIVLLNKFHSLFKECALPYFVKESDTHEQICICSHLSFASYDYKHKDFKCLGHNDRLCIYKKNGNVFSLVGLLDIVHTINDVSFHPKLPLILIASGNQEDFETHGELMVWNYSTNETTSILDKSRQINVCNYTKDGSVIEFIASGKDELDRDSYLYKIDANAATKVDLKLLHPETVKFTLDPPGNIEFSDVIGLKNLLYLLKVL